MVFDIKMEKFREKAWHVVDRTSDCRRPHMLVYCRDSQNCFDDCCSQQPSGKVTNDRKGVNCVES